MLPCLLPHTPYRMSTARPLSATAVQRPSHKLELSFLISSGLYSILYQHTITPRSLRISFCGSITRTQLYLYMWSAHLLHDAASTVGPNPELDCLKGTALPAHLEQKTARRRSHHGRVPGPQESLGPSSCPQRVWEAGCSISTRATRSLFAHNKAQGVSLASANPARGFTLVRELRTCWHRKRKTAI